MYGPTDLEAANLGLIGSSLAERVFGLAPGAPTEILHAASPTTYVASGDPPFLQRNRKSWQKSCMRPVQPRLDVDGAGAEEATPIARSSTPSARPRSSTSTGVTSTTTSDRKARSAICGSDVRRPAPWSVATAQFEGHV